MKKDLGIIGGLFVLIAVLLFFGQGFTSTGFISKNNNSAGTASGTAASNTATVKVKTMEVTATVADTPNERKKGLSKMDELPIDSGMLFVFESPGKYGIWMKDMKFAIDIIWIDENKKIVDIVKSAPSQPGKKDDELTIYSPKDNAKYVLEVNAGLSGLHGIQIGDEVSF